MRLTLSVSLAESHFADEEALITEVTRILATEALAIQRRGLKTHDIETFNKIRCGRLHVERPRAINTIERLQKRIDSMGGAA